MAKTMLFWNSILYRTGDVLRSVLYVRSVMRILFFAGSNINRAVS
jgi:hypothetical protein